MTLSASLNHGSATSGVYLNCQLDKTVNNWRPQRENLQERRIRPQELARRALPLDLGGSSGEDVCESFFDGIVCFGAFFRRDDWKARHFEDDRKVNGMFTGDPAVLST